MRGQFHAATRIVAGLNINRKKKKKEADALAFTPVRTANELPPIYYFVAHIHALVLLTLFSSLHLLFVFFFLLLHARCLPAAGSAFAYFIVSTLHTVNGVPK